MVWGVLHFVIVPRIAELRPQLEQYASKALGITVRVQSIAATSNGLIPSFELNNVSLHDAQGREVLRLPRVLAALSPRSAMGLGFEQLYIDSPVLEARRAPDGRIWVAGFVVGEDDSQHSKGMDWLFSQTELAIRHGTVHWSDEVRAAEPLVLSDVDLVLRNRLLSHGVHFSATPPPAWGQRVSLTGEFKEPLLSRKEGQWREWQGQVYADLPDIDAAQLGRYVDLGVAVTRGKGAVRAWLDVHRGALTALSADVALVDVNAQLSPKLEPLALKQISGRLGSQQLDGGVEFSTQALQFDTDDGLHWTGGNVRLARYEATTRKPATGELVADRLDLTSMVEIAKRLPVGEEVHAALKRFGPKGLIEQVQGTWSGPLEQPVQFAVKGRVVGLEVQAADYKGVSTPGVKGLNLDFDVSPSAGRATVDMKDGAIDTNDLFAEPVIAFDQLGGEVQWKVEAGRVSVNAPKLRFSNADAQGELQAKWTSGAQRAAGVLDLQGVLSRAQVKQVHRYLPLAMENEVRDYLRDALVDGTASDVRFKVKGDLQHFPFADAKAGEFRISAQVQNASFAFAPPSILAKDSLPWPTLNQLSGQLVIDRATLQVKGARGGVVGAPGLRITQADASITSLYHDGALALAVQAKGPLAEGLALVNGSPLGTLTNKVLAQASASGQADYQFKLALPILASERATVSGTVALFGNELQLSADTPRLSQARGVVSFSETGVSMAGMRARALGGDVRLDGGLNTRPSANTSVLRMQGVATAQGLSLATELGPVAQLGKYATGQTPYTVVLGVQGGVTELQVNSNLVGLALRLPAPFAKSADAPLPLRLQTSALRSAARTGVPALVPGQDQLQIDVGRLANMTYVRDVSGTSARVLRGAIGVGLGADEAVPLPSEGVVSNVRMDSVDVDAWSQLLSGLAGPDVSPPTQRAVSAAASSVYLPTSIAVRTRVLTFGGRTLNNVVVGGGREGTLWRANLDASELNGYVEYRQPTGGSAGRLYARLAKLILGQSTAQEVESLMDEQPSGIPALDVVVEDFELNAKKLGRLEIEAVNLAAGAPREASRASAREWRLNRFNIITPEAVLTASGNWTDLNTQAPQSSTRSIKERRRTVLNFKLDIADAGELLERFGMKGVIRRGRGKIDGQVAWLGSPITLDYPSLGGSFNVNVEEGQFLKADPGIAKLLGVLSLQSLPRRLTLDFRDVFTEGFAFDFLRGDVAIEQGIARTNNLQMKGVNAAVLMEGQADIAKETQAIKVVVVPEINAGSASLIASVINPLVGITSFLAQLILRRPLIESNTQEFFVDGTWVEPRVTKVERKAAPPPPPSPAKAGEAK